MVPTQLRGCVLKYSADRGVGFIKPLLQGTTTICCCGGDSFLIRPTDQFLFSVGDIPAKNWCQMSLSTEVGKRSTKMIPLLSVGDILLFKLRREKFQTGDFKSDPYKSFRCVDVRIDESTSQHFSHYLLESKWLDWRKEEKRLLNMLEEIPSKEHFILEGTQVDSVSGIPINF
ncbi:uncharacterized protein TM35_000112580 [Trypanosoma theileri]|uniref:Uncharacterized protein n=1 Tax=Trypanosoma theileri TaxID=67003 RepID=A0A1X0NYG2_9TRYP|nr:uncharacterized protein TM35_000112580 [Trypanosoma theileri]ORC89724.1 hypothetical protein TM35_000112580 [Trypanosoma theileri]